MLVHRGNITLTLPLRDDFGLGLNRNLKGFERYRMSGAQKYSWAMSFIFFLHFQLVNLKLAIAQNMFK